MIEVARPGDARQSRDEEGSFTIISGTTMRDADLLSPDLNDPDLSAARAESFRTAKPFPHLVIDGLFSPVLLDLIHDEFPPACEHFRRVETAHETTYRSRRPTDLGPAGQRYIDLVHSYRFVDYLSTITGVPDLIVDHALRGGGMHETVRGGRFEVHSDFNYHRETMLRNALVVITYLNRDWDAAWGGDLELWDARTRRCAARVAPLFGRTLIMRHGATAFHGHPAPLATPDGRSRRSIATYYYVNESADHLRPGWRSSVFLDQVAGRADRTSERQLLFAGAGRRRRTKIVVRDFAPPVLWRIASQLRWHAHATGIPTRLRALVRKAFRGTLR